ncbi:MAG: glycoside hydrolase family 3 N-terminal domain-containing protein [Bacteroidota bacterium]
MSLADLAARLIVVRMGSNMSPPRYAAEDADRIAAMLDRHPLGGVLMFNGRWPDTRDALIRLQSHSDHGLLVTTDMERGLGQQVRGGTIYPHQAAFGHADDLEATRAFARQSAEEALACGIHVTYSPVADVDREPQNPIIGARAFSSDPQRAARHVRAFIEGVHAGGQFATAKHYPGHGGTVGDSHAEMPTLNEDRATLEATDFVPFRAAIGAGVDLVMTAHVRYPALDPTGTPATRSAPILQGLLRDEMGFDGVVATDSLLMAGAKVDGRTEGELAAEMLAVGVDLLLDVDDVDDVVAGIVRAVENGTLAEARLREAFARVDALRQRVADRFGPGVFRDPSLAVAPEIVAAPEHAALASRVATAAVEVVRGPLPSLGEGDGTLVLLFKGTPRGNEPEVQPLGIALAETLPDASYRQIEPTKEGDDALFEEIRAQVEAASNVIIATVARPAAWRTFGLADREKRFVQHLMDAHPVTLAVLGDRRGLEGYDAAQAAVVTYSDEAPSQRALLNVLAGRT